MDKLTGVIRFQALQEEHLPLLRNWLNESHVTEFWQETDDENEFREKFLGKLQQRGVSAFMILLDDKPIGYIQHYEASKVGGGWWPDAKEGTFGMDQLIGDLAFINRGYGTLIIQKFVEQLFSKVHVFEIITDPDPKNKRAIRAYQKVGFEHEGEIKTPDGEALLMRLTRLKYYCEKWNLIDAICLAKTFTSDVYKVKLGNQDAVLKILNQKGQQFESKGAVVLRYFNGNGAVRLLNSDEGAHLLEFIDGPQLKSLVERGADDEATEIICDVVAKLHSCDGPRADDLISMESHFRALFEKAEKDNAESIYTRAAKVARKLIDSSRDLRVLHGDIHHENILRHPIRGWVAIDPQCLYGERAYDLANVFYNPNGYTELAASSERIVHLCRTFTLRLGIERQRLLQFAFAYGCLSAAWCILDDQNPEETLKIADKIELLMNEPLNGVQFES